MNIFQKLKDFFFPPYVYEPTAKGRLFMEFLRMEENQGLEYNESFEKFEEHYKTLADCSEIKYSERK